MPRTARVGPGGMVQHVLNRGVGRRRLFRDDTDDAACQCAIEETLKLAPMRICGDCRMPNHWHLVPWGRPCLLCLGRGSSQAGNKRTKTARGAFAAVFSGPKTYRSDEFSDL
jgi:hypothetical protein